MKKNQMIYSMTNLPTPMNISYMWNVGSLLGLCLMIQIITGFFLSMHYTANMNLAFNSIIHIMQNVNYGWIIRFIHMNGASFFFMCMYLHIGRGIYYSSYKFKNTWIIGIFMYLITMMTAFLGYVLPWGQMSLWGATVITNLISAIPMIGGIMVKWVWGGFSVSNPTLNRFYSFHFIAPFIVMFLTLIHLFFLHLTGSTNPLGLNSNFTKIAFHPYFTYKDLMGLIFMIIILLILCLSKPYIFMDPDNYIKANAMVTPPHIKPEWYFLFAYAILRSIPNKLGGVIALISSILILMVLPYLPNNYLKSFKFKMFNKVFYWNFIMIFFTLTWIGSNPVENPFIFIGQSYSIMYFIYFFTIPFFFKK